MAVETEVLVIGGGATGAGVARDLALRGVDVTLVERGGLSSGTSGRSHGLLHSGARYAEADARGAEECLEKTRSSGTSPAPVSTIPVVCSSNSPMINPIFRSQAGGLRGDRNPRADTRR